MFLLVEDYPLLCVARLAALVGEAASLLQTYVCLRRDLSFVFFPRRNAALGDDDATTSARRRGRRHQCFDMCVFSADDSRVITSQSEERAEDVDADCAVRVWCALSGTLLHDFREHTRKVIVLQP